MSCKIYNYIPVNTHNEIIFIFFRTRAFTWIIFYYLDRFIFLFDDLSCEISFKERVKIFEYFYFSGFGSFEYNRDQSNWVVSRMWRETTSNKVCHKYISHWIYIHIQIYNKVVNIKGYYLWTIHSHHTNNFGNQFPQSDPYL